jgi:hypothetical protein
MSELFAVECPEAPIRENRFATFGNEYSGFQSIHFVPLSKVIYRDRRTNALVCAKGLSLCQRMTDDLHQAVRDGWSQKWLSSARVVKYISATQSFETVYTGKEQEHVRVEPEVPKAFLCQDGTWRVPPETGFSRGTRESSLSIAHVDRTTNQAYADRIVGQNKLRILQKLFDSPLPWVIDLTKTYPLANPQDIPAPPQPVVEYVPTQAEIDAAPAMTHEEFDKLPAAVINEQFILDPIFRARIRKMEAEDARKLVIFNQQQEQKDFKEAAAALRKKKAADADNEAFKTGGR